jgi:hypothetical protein
MSFSLYEPGLDEDTTKKGPSHLSYSFPIVSGLAILRSTKCPGLIFFNLTFLSRHLIVSAWYLLMWSIAWSLTPSIVSFVILHVSSSSVEARVLIDHVLASSGVIASSPNKSLNRVNPVDLETTVLWFHTTFTNSSGHFPFGRLKIDFIISMIMISLARFTNPLYYGFLRDAKCIFVQIWSQKVLNVLASNWVPLSTAIAFVTPNRQTMFCQKNFWTVVEVIIARGLASIHFEKYFTPTTTYFKFPCAGGSGPSKSRPHLCSGQVGCISWVRNEGWFWSLAHFCQFSHFWTRSAVSEAAFGQ